MSTIFTLPCKDSLLSSVSFSDKNGKEKAIQTYTSICLNKIVFHRFFSLL